MFRISKKDNEKYFYSLNSHDSHLIKWLGVIGFITTIFIVLGYMQFLYISPVLALLFGPVLVVILLYHLIQYFLLSVYPGFDLPRHKAKILDYWRKSKDVPRVAVFIPAAGEPVDVVEGTVLAATKINYPNFQVYVLDDSKGSLYKDIASKHGAAYISRTNKGHYKKAGNMNHALNKLDGYDQILVLDADFQPRAEILRELIPYTSKEVGIIQSPQHFPLDAEAHSRSKIEYGAAYIQRDFYRITQVARNKFGAAICVGTSALYNIEALRRVGGYEGVGQPRGWSHSEDVHTGLKMLNAFTDDDKQYKILYIPIQLAKGTCPDTHHSFYKQQNRWATGSMQLISSDKTVRSRRLTLMQRIIYGSNSLYYFYTISLLVSPLYLLALALSSQPSSWAFTLYFIPSLVFKHVIEPYVMRRDRAPLATGLVVMSNAYTYLQAALLLLIKKPLGWEATGTKGPTKKSIHFTHFKLSAATISIGLYVLTLGALIMNEHFEFGPSIFIVCLFISSFLAHIAFLFYTLIVSSDHKNRILDRKLYAFFLIFGAIFGVVYLTTQYHAKYDIVFADNKVQIIEQRSYDRHTETIVDGYRRTIGDIKNLVGL